MKSSREATVRGWNHSPKVSTCKERGAWESNWSGQGRQRCPLLRNLWCPPLPGGGGSKIGHISSPSCAGSEDRGILAENVSTLKDAPLGGTGTCLPHKCQGESVVMSVGQPVPDDPRTRLQSPKGSSLHPQQLKGIPRPMEAPFLEGRACRG